MQMSVEDFREGFRKGTLVFCMPAAHAEFSSDFLDDFSERILKQDWRDLLESSDLNALALFGTRDAESELVDAIRDNYGADVSDLPGLPLWEVMRRCAGSAKA
jgi:hypothetical protein